jgi:hypothetical protein
VLAEKALDQRCHGHNAGRVRARVLARLHRGLSLKRPATGAGKGDGRKGAKREPGALASGSGEMERPTFRGRRHPQGQSPYPAVEELGSSVGLGAGDKAVGESDAHAVSRAGFAYPEGTAACAWMRQAATGSKRQSTG